MMKKLLLIRDLFMFLLSALCLWRGLLSGVEGDKVLYFAVSAIIGFMVTESRK
jgi:hypothetical protein